MVTRTLRRGCVIYFYLSHPPLFFKGVRNLSETCSDHPDFQIKNHVGGCLKFSVQVKKKRTISHTKPTQVREAGNMNFKSRNINLDVIYFHRLQMVEIEWPDFNEKYIQYVNVNKFSSSNNNTSGRRGEQKLGVD